MIVAGEPSKHSGEIGEALAGAFLAAIGWKTKLSKVSIACNNPNHKTASGNQRNSHGDDFVFVYNSPFYDDRTDAVHVSVKNNLNGYSSSVQTLKTTLKEHLLDINQMMSCAQFDDTVSGLIQHYKPRRSKTHSGLLIWLSSTIGSQDENILEKVSNIKLLDCCEHPVYFVDNARANFILRVVRSANDKTGGNFKFYYPDNGGLTSRRNEHYGDVLPLEHIVSDVIPIKGEIESKDVLLLYGNEPFSATAYKKLIWLGMAFANGWPRKIYIGFPDYNSAIHFNEAAAAARAFDDRDKELIPFCYFDSLLSELKA